MRLAPKAERTTPDGIVFHSRGEMRRWCELQLLERGREISGLRRQVRFELKDQFSAAAPVLTPSGRVASFTIDFVYRDRAGNLVFEDWKGMRTRESDLRIAVFERFYQVKVTRSGPNRRAKKGRGSHRGPK